MKNLFLTFALLFLLFAAGCASQKIYIGGNDGVHLAEYKGVPLFKSWNLTKADSSPNVSYMAVKKGALYTARRVTKGVFCVDVFKIKRDGLLEKQSSFTIPGTQGYCHLSLSRDGKFLYGSSYSGAFADILALSPKGEVKLAHRLNFSGQSIHKRQTKSHPHFASVTPDQSKLLVADLGSDKIHVFELKKGAAPIRKASIPLPPGSGPRHLSFSADGKFLFAANELNNTVCSFSMENFALRSTLSLLPGAWSGTSYAGAIKTAPDGTVFVTNRGHNSIAVLAAAADGKLKMVDEFSSSGDFPYDLLFSKGKHFLVNMKSDEFSVWKKQGAWEKEVSLTLRRPMCLAAVPEK